MKILQDGLKKVIEQSERSNLEALLDPLKKVVETYARSNFAGVPGAERALVCFLGFLRQWISVERWFYDLPSHADAIDKLRRAHKDNLEPILGICRAHGQLAASTELVIRIISIIGDGSRVDYKNSATSAIGKRVSLVAGAESLPLAMPLVSEIGAMGVSDEYAEVALRARKVLMQESMPSLEQRRQKLLAAARALTSSTRSQLPLEAEALIADHIPMADVFLPLLQTINESKEEVGLLELYLRNLYSTYTIRGFKRDSSKRMVAFSFFNKPSEGAIHAGMSVSSMTELSRMVSSGSLNHLNDSSERSADGSVTAVPPPRISQTTLRTGACIILDKFERLHDLAIVEDLLSVFPQRDSKGGDGGAINVVYLIVLDRSVGADEQSSDDFAKECSELLSAMKDRLLAADIRRISLILQRQREDEFSDVVPALFTFRSPKYTEDSLYRQIDPSLSMHLQLDRVATNFRIKARGSRHTSTCHVHLYEGTPRSVAIAKDRSANKHARIFARVLSSMLEFSSSGFERTIVDALNAMDLCALKSKSDNHLFVNLLGDFEGTVIDPVVVEQVVGDILKRHGDRVAGLGIVEVETRIVCSLSANSPPIALRLFASNPTGFVQVMDTYVEAADEMRPGRVFKLISGTKARLASAGDSSWDGLRIDMPYPLTRPFDGQRKSALESSDTVYCYDLPALFEAAVEMQWRDSPKKFGMDGPLMVMYTNELVVQWKGKPPTTSWTMEDYLAGKLELSTVDRRAGLNNVGMVAWQVTLKTVEYPNVRTLLIARFGHGVSQSSTLFQGRQVILIANDITHKAGSFGTREDVVFKMASEYARSRRIPRIFIAANSGARIGLADKVKKRFKVAFKDESKPELGFDFLYLSKEDYHSLTVNSTEVIAEEMTRNGETIYKVKDILGSEPDLGVENLKGSGLIAGETSTAYDDIFTLTIVLGRTVGIGAYLVRLGQRTIQKSSASPIILTGYQALNKLMGTDVYSTNDQLGGPGIMYKNVSDHGEICRDANANKCFLHYRVYPISSSPIIWEPSRPPLIGFRSCHPCGVDSCPSPTIAVLTKSSGRLNSHHRRGFRTILGTSWREL
jgi:acetyl-CoA carboxylase / biotin carboxylase 1